MKYILNKESPDGNLLTPDLLFLYGSVGFVEYSHFFDWDVDYEGWL